MTQNDSYKRYYHPLIILMYHSNMLSLEELNKIPKRTRYNWNYFNHENYYGYEIAKPYIKDFDLIKDVLTSRYLLQATKFICTLSSGYRNLIQEMEGSKKLMRKHADRITYFIEKLSKVGNLKKKDACRVFGVNRDWFYRHKRKIVCKVSKIDKCFKQYPSQLTIEQAQVIEKIVKDPKNKRKRKNTLYWLAMRKDLVICGRTTFYKYLDLFGYKKPQKKKPPTRKKGFKASRVFEWLHVDVTHVHTIIDGIQYVAYVKDNFSGALLHYKSIPFYPSSNFIRDLLEEAFTKFNLLDAGDPINILSDGGPENKGSVIDWINQLVAPPVVKKVTAQTPEFEYSNSMSESTHSIYKGEFMGNQFSIDMEQHIKDQNRFMNYYNHERYLCRLHGLTPFEVLEGQIPCKSWYKAAIQQTKEQRIIENRSFNTCARFWLIIGNVQFGMKILSKSAFIGVLNSFFDTSE